MTKTLAGVLWEGITTQQGLFTMNPPGLSHSALYGVSDKNRSHHSGLHNSDAHFRTNLRALRRRQRQTNTGDERTGSSLAADVPAWNTELGSSSFMRPHWHPSPWRLLQSPQPQVRSLHHPISPVPYLAFRQMWNNGALTGPLRSCHLDCQKDLTIITWTQWP